MANLTITVDEDVLKRARIRALERGESVNQFLAQRLLEYAGVDEEIARKRDAARRFIELSNKLARRPVIDGKLTREEIWERSE